jgi:hypothetical protein
MIDDNTNYLSEFTEDKNGIISFPRYYLDDFFIDELDETDYTIEHDRVYLREGTCNLVTLRAIRQKYYNANYWYDAIAHLTILSFFIHKNDNWDNLFLAGPKFIRGVHASPKDIHPNCIFYNASHAKAVLFNSYRCKNDEIFFVRDIDDDILHKRGFEFRCFYYHGKFTAASCEEYINLDECMENRIVQFIANNAHSFPYTDAIIDIFVNDKKILIIEFNCFGADSFTGAGQFDWEKEYNLLTGKNNLGPLFKCNQGASPGTPSCDKELLFLELP